MIKKKVIAIIVTFNRKNYLLRTINSLYQQTYKVDEIICVDNCSTDGTQKYLLDNDIIGRKNFHYYNTGANLGGAGGFKYGIDCLKDFEYEHVWLMDDDVELESNCLEILISSDHSSKGIVQPTRYYEDGEFFSYDYKYFNFKNPLREFKLGRVTSEDIENNESIKIAAVPFEGPLIASDVINAIGNVNDEYFIIADDTDYSIRASRAGFYCFLIPEAKLKRLIKPCSGQDPSWKVFFFHRNVTLVDKYYSPKYVLYIRACVRVMRYVITVSKRKKTISNFVAMIHGVLAAMKNDITNNITDIQKKYADKK